MEKPQDASDPQLPLELKEQLAKPLDPEVLKQIPPQLQAALAIHAQATVHYSQGPLPPADELRKYAEIFPGAPERLFAWVEKQADHRIAIEKQVIASQQKQSARGQIFGFVIAIMGLAVACWVTLGGHPAAGTAIGAIDLVGLVSVFVLGQNAQKANLKEKAVALPQRPPSI